MRWATFFIFAYLVVALQMAIGGHFVIWGAQPNLVLIAAVFIAINAAREPALLGCFLLGLLQDVASAQRFGIYALSYGTFALLAGGFLGGSSRVRRSPIVHVMMAVFCGVITAVMIVIHSWLPFTHESRASVLVELWAAIYAMLLAPVLIWLILDRLRPLFSFDPPRRRSRT